MGSRIDSELVKQIQLMDAQSLEELQEFVALLLSKKQVNLTPEKRPTKAFLTDLQRVAVPVNNVVISRSEYV